MVPVNKQLVPSEDNSAADRQLVLCIVRDITNPQWNRCKITINLQEHVAVHELCEEIARQANYEANTFNLVWQKGGTDGQDDVVMNKLSHMSLREAGLLPGNKRNFFQIQDKEGIQPVPINAGATGITVTNGDDNIAAMAAAAACSEDSDTRPLITAPTVDTCAPFTDYSYSYASSVTSKSESGYVGLINQAMTCYLNSLLQTLYMTPEFRNALYRWCFNGSIEDATKSIPYQLQRLFVQLQTSTKRSIETYDVTKSFGWDSNEAWHQHDVQELCRVMFDALETKFKNTENEDLINRLYQGQMKDYVKCLECGNESARKDSFLDIPLVIRPFGSTKTNGSVQEALQAFITPETLNDTNQYFCERCNKKCDAHKGLKFQSFPYVLTLQLKRFDFDYSTYTRLKLNDKVSFPEILNMNKLLEDDEEEEDETNVASDTQSDEHNLENLNNLTNARRRSESPDDTIDEGIDVEQAASATTPEESQTIGPYLYELFSIMVHSGTANGGHYYAYIKSFSDGRWYCFNDTSVTHATKEDIRRTYGIEALPGRCAPNSTLPNAYMLMYRQIETAKNAGFTTVEDFPSHIKELVVRLQNDEEEERRQREIDRNTCKIKLFGVHPMTGKPVEARLEVHKDKTLSEATEIAHKLLAFDKHTPLDQCRLVKYDEFHESLERSFEGDEGTPMGTLLSGVKTSYIFDLLLETRKADQEFAVYKAGGVTNKLFVVDLETESISNPISMRSYLTTTVQDFKVQIAQTTGLSGETMRVVLEPLVKPLVKPLVNGHKTLKNEGFLKSNKVFVESSNIEDSQVPFPESKLYQLLDRYANTIRLQVTLPLSDQDEFKPPKSSSTSPCPSSASSNTEEKYTDLQLETEIALSKAPTPSPTGSSSTLSDDHPLDKNGLNLLGSETDSGVVSLNDARITDDMAGDSDGNLADLRGSPDGAVDNDGEPDMLIRSEVGDDDDVDIPGGEVQSGDTGITADGACWCQSDCGDCCKLQGLNSEQSSTGAVSSPVSSHSSLSSPVTSVTDHKSSSIPIEPDPGAGGETKGTMASYDDPNEDSEDEIYENTRHTKMLNGYFKAEPVQIIDNARLLPVHVDKRMTLAVFKKSLEPYVGRESQHFKVYRVYANNQEFESIRLTETLQSYSEDSKVIIKLGRALKKGEYRVKIYQLTANGPEPCKYLFDCVFAKGMSVVQSKTELIPELREKCGLDIPLKRLRLRKKAWKNPGAIYIDSQLYEDDIPIFTNWEVFVEILERDEPLVEPTHLVLFVKRWRPSEFKLDPFEEVLLSDCTVAELKKRLSALSDISPENIDFAKGKGTFPCEVSLLEMQSDLEWNPQVTSLNSWPLYISDDGAVIYYCDKSEAIKELTEEEKQEIQKKENSRLAKTTQKPSYPSPRKERALKIYTDSTTST